MANQPNEETLIGIELTQVALRHSIEEARDLAAEAERLVRRHRGEIAQAKPPNPV